MPRIISVGTYDPPHVVTQEIAFAAAKDHFQAGFSDVGRMLRIFQNTEIKQRHFSMPLSWFFEEHTLQDRNDTYIRLAQDFGIEAIQACLHSPVFLNREVAESEIDAIIFVSTTGMSTPSIEARIMNRRQFSPHTKRIPIWGLGCAGGGAGLARAHEFCTAYPQAKVLMIALELCSLTFQKKDLSKSNLVGASIFADGAACALVAGDDANLDGSVRKPLSPVIRAHQTTLMPQSETVMGWDIKDEGLYVVFSKDIPTIIRTWLRGNVDEFLEKHSLTREDIKHFVAHPGGRKILEAYQDALEMSEEMTAIPREVLSQHGNMSSPSAIYVLKEVMQTEIQPGDYGLMAALGPGFTSELLLLQWV
jgi:alkylresorcinol/alkylpyrone synthase